MAQRNAGILPRNAQIGDTLVALHDFEARSGDELSLSKGDKIELIERDDEFGDGWYLGRHEKSGYTGLFPEVYTAISPAKPALKPVKPPIVQPGSTIRSPEPLSTNNDTSVVKTAVASPIATAFNSNSTPSTLQRVSVSNPTLSTSTSASGLATASRNISIAHQEHANDSPVMNETLSVIDEHMTDMTISRQNVSEPANDSGSEYSAFLDHRLSYITGHETDEEEEHIPNEQEVVNWSFTQVAEHLENIGVESKHCRVFKEQEISGEVLLAMDQASIFMKEFDLGLVGQRLRTWQKIKAFQDELRASAHKNRGSKQQHPSESQSVNFRLSRVADSLVDNSVVPMQSSPMVAQRGSVDASQDSFQQKHDIRPTSILASQNARSGLESPSRPSAASIREMNHSRRHSAADFAQMTTPSTPTEVVAPALAQNTPASPGVHSHKKAPSLDQNWTMTSPRVPTLRPLSQIGSTGWQTTPPMPAYSPNANLTAVTPPGFSSPRPAPSPRIDDRGYKSGDELDNKKARNVLKKRDTLTAAHSRQGSYQNDGNKNARRHSRFSSVDSIKETVAALANTGARVAGRGHFRNSSAGDAISKTTSPLIDPDLSVPIKFDGSPKIPARPEPVSLESGGSLASLKEDPGDDGQTIATDIGQSKIGLRAISDAVTKEEKSVATPSATPTVTSMRNATQPLPPRTGSTTPSGTSQILDRESTDTSSKGTGINVPSAGGSIPVARKKAKHETSAYTRGLENKSPREQLVGCDYSGWMKKKSSNLMATWKPRLFILHGRRLSYYYSEDDTQEKGLIDISGHRVLAADTDILTGIHAVVTGAKSTPVSPASIHTPTLASAESAAQDASPLEKLEGDTTFIFKLVPPRSGLSRAVNFTKPTIHYFAVDNIRQGRLWMAALMKATIDRDESQPVTTSYQEKTISLARAQKMRQRPPALMNLKEPVEGIEETAKQANEAGLNISGLSPLKSANGTTESSSLKRSDSSTGLSKTDSVGTGPTNITDKSSVAESSTT